MLMDFMRLELPAAIVALTLSNVASAIAFGATTPRKALSLAFAFTTAALPWFIDASPLAVGVLTMGSLLPVVHFVDLARDARSWPVGFRVWLFLTPFDTRRVTRAPARADARLFLTSLAFGALLGGSYWIVVTVAPALTGVSKWALRWLFGAALVYALLDSSAALITFMYHCAGMRPPVLHDAPIRSRSLGELWGARWNRAVHSVFEQHCFRPLARRRHVSLGVLAAFAMSALLHGWLVLVALRDPKQAALMCGFFIAQGLLVLVERPLGVARWPPARGRLWTIGWSLATMPMFVEPLARTLGV